MFHTQIQKVFQTWRLDFGRTYSRRDYTPVGFLFRIEKGWQARGPGRGWGQGYG